MAEVSSQSCTDYELDRRIDEAMNLVQGCVRFLTDTKIHRRMHGPNCPGVIVHSKTDVPERTCNVCQGQKSTTGRPPPCQQAACKRVCLFSTARAIMAISKAYQFLKREDINAVSENLVDLVNWLIDNSRIDNDKIFGDETAVYWWSSDLAPMEVTRTTAAAVFALQEFRKCLKDQSELQILFKSLDKLEATIKGGIHWLCATMAMNDVVTPVFKKKNVDESYLAILFRGSWSNIPHHIHSCLRECIQNIESRELRPGQELSFDELIKHAEFLECGYVKDFKETMCDDEELFRFLVTPEIQWSFDIEATKEALMALATDRENCADFIKKGAQCLRENVRPKHLWSELICMNFHTILALLMAEPEETSKEWILDSHSNFKGTLSETGSYVPVDICMLVSSMLVEFYLGGRTEETAARLLKEKDIFHDIFTLKKEIQFRIGTRVFCYHHMGFPAVPQTSWVVYATSTILEPLKNYVERRILLEQTIHKKPVEPSATSQKRFQSKDEFIVAQTNRLKSEGCTEIDCNCRIGKGAQIQFDVIAKSKDGKAMEVLRYFEGKADSNCVCVFYRDVISAHPIRPNLETRATFFAQAFLCNPKQEQTKLDIRDLAIKFNYRTYNKSSGDYDIL